MFDIMADLYTMDHAKHNEVNAWKNNEVNACCQIWTTGIILHGAICPASLIFLQNTHITRPVSPSSVWFIKALSIRQFILLLIVFIKLFCKLFGHSSTVASYPTVKELSMQLNPIQPNVFRCEASL